MVALQILKFVVFFVCFLIKFLDPDDRNPARKGKNYSLYVTLSCKVMKLWVMNVCQHPV